MSEAETRTFALEELTTGCFDREAPRLGQVIFRPDLRFNGIKVFSATMPERRGRLGETVSEWIAAHLDMVVTDVTVTQSSDADFHCLTITLAYWQPIASKECSSFEL
jgi:hypothetical protein